MNIKDKKWKRRTPEVKDVCEFLEIARDYIDPKDAIREAISNAIDWGAKEIEVVIEEDKSRPDEELIIKIKDDGIGLDKDRLEAFLTSVAQQLVNKVIG